MAWVAVVVLLGAGLTGCLGETQQPTELDHEETDANATATAADGNESPAGGTASAEPPAEPDGTVAACAEAGAGVRASIASHLEDPFADRDPAEPELLVCGDDGLLRLAAFGLSGPGVLSVGLEIPTATVCDGYIAAAATGGTDRIYLEGWDRPEGSGSVGVATGSSGPIVGASAGPVDTDEVAGTGGGSTAWGSGFEEAAFDAGLHRFTAVGNAWGGWETSLTEGAPLLFLLACKDPIRFQGFATTETMAMFSGNELDTGAGVRGPLFSGASVGRALDLDLPEGGVLRFRAVALGGVGSLVITDGESRTEHVFAPLEGLSKRQDVPRGGLTVDLVRGGALVLVAGAAHGMLGPTSVESAVGP